MRVRRLNKTPAQLEITAFINLIVVLVPFLLSTAVFTRLAVLDLALPAPSAAVEQLKVDRLQLELVIRPDAVEVGDRIGGLIQRFARGAAGIDTAALSTLMQQLKARFPAQTDASVLAEPDTPYDDIVQVMDAVRRADLVQGERVEHRDLFPDIAVGDAPLRQATRTR